MENWASDCGVLIVGHGTRDPEGVAGFVETVQQVRAAILGLPVEPSFLEFARPTIAEGVGSLLDRGVRRVAVLPLMLFAARHVRRDIPAALACALAGHPEIETHQGVHLGCHPRVVELSRKRYWESLTGRAAVPSEQTLLLLVGRGARDPEALREMRHFAELRQRVDAIDRIEVCFASMAEPSLEAMLARVVHQLTRRIVVQPHLLFPGRLLACISATVARYAQSCPSLDWVTSGPLGPDPLLAQAMVEILSSAGE